MYKIEDRYGWNDDSGYLRTRLYQNEKSFEKAWKILMRGWDLSLTGGLWMKLVAYKINHDGQWEFVRERKRT